MFCIAGVIGARPDIMRGIFTPAHLPEHFTCQHDIDFFGWMGGNAMSLLNYFVFLTPTIAYPDGQLNPAGHQMYGVVGAWLIFGSMFLSSAGLHKIITELEEPVKNENFDDIKKE